MTRARAAFAAILSLAALFLAVAPGRAERRDDWEAYQRVDAALGPCADPAMRLPAYRGFDPHRDMLRKLDAALEVAPEACPGFRERAVAQAQLLVGDPIRGDADLGALGILEQAAREGRGMAADPALALRYRRLLWLLDDFGRREGIDPTKPPPDMNIAQGEAWLASPDVIALLEARVATAPTDRAVRLLAEIRLRRDVPGYDPVRAIDLYATRLFGEDDDYRLAVLLSDGAHVAPDFPRAAQRLRKHAADDYEPRGARGQRALLRIADRAEAAARTDQDRHDILAILAAAALDGVDDGRQRFDAALARIDPRPRRVAASAVQKRAIYDALAEKLAYAMDWAYDSVGPDYEDPKGLGPIRMAALLDPAGRIVATTILQPSGSPVRDRQARAVYVEHRAVVALPELSRGRYVWIKLLPLDPYLTIFKVWDARKTDGVKLE